MHQCQCKPDCPATVKADDVKFARGHNPASHKDYETRAKKISVAQKRNFANGRVNPFKGRKHSRKTRKLLSAKRNAVAADPKHKKIFARAMKKRGRNEEWLGSMRRIAPLGAKAHADISRGVPIPESVKQKISDGYKSFLNSAAGRRYLTQMSARLKADTENSNHCRRIAILGANALKEYKGVIYNGIYMRSSWEKRFAESLDARGVTWQYEPHTFQLNGKGRENTYLPDFYLPEFDLYVEMKGYLAPEAEEKYRTFRAQYPEINWALFQPRKAKAIDRLVGEIVERCRASC